VVTHKGSVSPYVQKNAEENGERRTRVITEPKLQRSSSEPMIPLEYIHKHTQNPSLVYNNRFSTQVVRFPANAVSMYMVVPA
jgi:hypothetical protein